MNLNLDKLKAMSRDELIAFADTQGVQVHWKAKPETIIKAIIDRVTNPPKPPVDVVDPRKVVTKEPVFNSKEAIESMLEKIKARVPQFESIYDDNDRCVTFRCKGAEECHNMSVPLHWLKSRAELVSRGKMVLLGLNQHFDSMVSATGKNSYTNTVLS